MIDPSAAEQSAAIIEDADAILVTAGAGMGVDSGLPDFRGNAGFWRTYPAIGHRGLQFHEIANPKTFKLDPRLAWGFYGHRLALYRRTVPHVGFALLKRWGESKRCGHAVFTSNVDGHFQAAGFDGVPIHECHGSLNHLQCSRPCSDAIWNASTFTPDVDDSTCTLRNDLPLCPRCDAVARPNVLMFDDDGWLSARATQQERALDRWLDQAHRLVVIELGAGTAIPSVRNFSHSAIIHRAAMLIRIDPVDDAVSRSCDISLKCGALEGLCDIEGSLGKKKQSQRPPSTRKIVPGTKKRGCL